jgi:hypothetical protein
MFSTSCVSLALCLFAAIPVFGTDNPDDVKFKAIYTKEWAWRQGGRGEIDEDSAGGRRGVSAPNYPK